MSELEPLTETTHTVTADEAESTLPEQYKSVDLKKYAETRYLSNNSDLKIILGQLEQGSVAFDESVYNMLKTNNYRDFDEYVRANPTGDKFFKILQQILMYEYFIPETERINRSQVQNALGIQQARWSTDSENCNKIVTETNAEKITSSYSVEDVILYYWQEIDETVKTLILNDLLGYIKDKRYPGNDINSINECLNGTIWYKLITNPPKASSSRWFGFPKAGYEEERFFPIPETIRNLSLVSCIYVPELAFGTIGSPTLTKHMIVYKKRLYSCHLPKSKRNLCFIHNFQQPILKVWFHDFYHSKNGDCNANYDFFNEAFHKYKPSAVRITPDNIMEQIENPESDLNDYINLISRQERLISRIPARPDKQYLNPFMQLNDRGATWTEIPSFGGRKSKKRRKRKTKKYRKRNKRTLKTMYRKRRN